MPPMFLKPNVVLSNSWIWRGTEISTGACGSLSVRNSAGPSHLIGWGFTRWRWTNWGVVDFKKCLVQGELNDIDISTDPFLKNQYCFREGIHWLFCGKKTCKLQTGGLLCWDCQRERKVLVLGSCWCWWVCRLLRHVGWNKCNFVAVLTSYIFFQQQTIGIHKPGVHYTCCIPSFAFVSWKMTRFCDTSTTFPQPHFQQNHFWRLSISFIFHHFLLLLGGVAPWNIRNTAIWWYFYISAYYKYIFVQSRMKGFESKNDWTTGWHTSFTAAVQIPGHEMPLGRKMLGWRVPFLVVHQHI